MEKLIANKNKGFTLVELIVVIVIIAILAAIAIPALTGYVNKTKNVAAIAEGNDVLTALTAATNEVYGFGTVVNGDQDGMLNWNGGSIKSYHYNPGSQTTGYSMVAAPNAQGVLQPVALKHVAGYLNKTEAEIIPNLYCLIVSPNNHGTGKNDAIAAFVWKVSEDQWVAYDSNNAAGFQVFETANEALAFAKNVSPGFS